jgi:hypothetical protein
MARPNVSLGLRRPATGNDGAGWDFDPDLKSELWTVSRGSRRLRAVTVPLPNGFDLRLLEDAEFRRTVLCPDIQLAQ